MTNQVVWYNHKGKHMRSGAIGRACQRREGRVPKRAMNDCPHWWEEDWKWHIYSAKFLRNCQTLASITASTCCCAEPDLPLSERDTPVLERRVGHSLVERLPNETFVQHPPRERHHTSVRRRMYRDQREHLRAGSVIADRPSLLHPSTCSLLERQK